jgi:hypothetical protein
MQEEQLVNSLLQKIPRLLDLALIHLSILFPILQQLTDRQHRVRQ